MTRPPTLLLAGLAALLTTWLLTRPVWRAALRWGAVDEPGPRKVHADTRPRWGGLAVAAGIAAGLAVVANLRPVDLFDEPGILGGLIGGSLLVLAVGAWDDRRRLRAPVKFAVQLAAATLAWWCGIRFGAVTHPLTGLPVELGWLSVPLTLGWLVLVTNAWNLIDGLDGLAALLGFIASVLFAAALIVRQVDASLVLVVPLVGALAGFLPRNLPPARGFLGDSGSYLIGFQLAALAILTGQKGITGFAVFGPLLVLALPVIDTLVTMLRRLVRHRNLADMFRPDRGHIHHRALAAGIRVRDTVAALALLGMLLGLGGLAVTMVRDLRLGMLLLLVGGLALVLFYAGTVAPETETGRDADEDRH